MHFQVIPSIPHTEPIPPEAQVKLPALVQRRFLEDHSLADTERGSKEAQWINCDIRSFDYSVLGQYVKASRLSGAMTDEYAGSK